MKYYDFNTRVLPEGADSSTRLSLEAKEYGYAGIATLNTPEYQAEVKAVEGGARVYPGVMIEADNVRQLKGRIGTYRGRVVVLAVRGGVEKINRAAVEDPRVDVLSHPHTRRGGGLNHVLARAAADNRVAIEYDLGQVIHGRGGSRVRVLTGFRDNLKLCRKYDAPMLLTSGARSKYDLRAPREMIALAGLFDMTKGEAEAALSTTPEEIIRRRSPPDGQVMPGVEVVE